MGKVKIRYQLQFLSVEVDIFGGFFGDFEASAFVIQLAIYAFGRGFVEERFERLDILSHRVSCKLFPMGKVFRKIAVKVQIKAFKVD